jgi:vacuolar protein-sorting-associated protein 4
MNAVHPKLIEYQKHLKEFMSSDNKRVSVHHLYNALAALDSYSESTNHLDDVAANMIRTCRQTVLNQIQLNSVSISNTGSNDRQKPPNLPPSTLPKHVSSDAKKESQIGNFVEPTVSWTSIIGMNAVKSDLQQMLAQPVKTPQFYNENFKPTRNVILWGPPGTGKTVLAEACAKMLGAVFMSVKASDFIDKYVGSSERNVASLFSEAASVNGRCVLFFDEFESFTRRRDGTTTEHGNQLTNELLRLTDPEKVSPNVYIFAATNNVTMIDDAIGRRFQRKLFVALPGYNNRIRLLSHFLSLDGTVLSDEQLHTAANITEYYSPSDIKNVISAARDAMLKHVCSATHFRQLDDGTGKFVPCDRNDMAAQPIEEIDSQLILKPNIELQHIIEATNKIQATCTPTLRKHYLRLLGY